MSEGNLIQTPYAKITSTLELLDRLGVSAHDLEVLRKCSSWGQEITARVLKSDPFLWGMLEMEATAEKAGFFPGDFRKLGRDEELLKQVLQVVRGHAAVTPMAQYIINCDAAPFELSGLTVAPKSEQLLSRVRGQLVFDPAGIRLHLSPNQQSGKYIKGEKLRKELALACEPVLTAHVLDFLLANPTLIPEEWKEKTNGYTTCIFFWGTIYCDADGYLCVRYLYWRGGRWYWDYRWLSYGWLGYNPAALRAS